MAGDGSDQRALQYEQTLVSPTGPATGHGYRPDSIQKKKKFQLGASRCVRAELTGVCMWHWQVLLEAVHLQISAFQLT